MKKHIIAGLLLLCCHANVMAGDIYVSAANGNDKNAGTIDSPLLTVEQALKQAREWRRLKSPETVGGINIILRQGTYRPIKPIYVRPEDSGTADSPTIICSMNGERATISGGREVTGWEMAGDVPGMNAKAKSKLWVTSKAPMTGNHAIETRQLWVDGKKAMRAQQFGADVMERMIAFDTTDESITIPTPDFDLNSASQLEMLVHQRWATAILRVREAKNIGNGQTKVWFHQPESQIEFAHPWPQPVIDGERGNSSFCLQNDIQLLDEPGEWYQPYDSHKIYYLPKEDGSNIENANVVVPVMETLIEIGGTRERNVSHIIFRNISFEHTAWSRPSHEGHVTLQGGFRFIDGYKLYEPGLFHNANLENQAWIARPEAAVTAQFAHDLNFEGCSFKHTGATALDLRYAVSNSNIIDCTLEDIGGTGILVGYFGEGGFETHIPYKPAIDDDLCNNILIKQCRITDAANEDWGCVAIGAGYVRDMTITANTVSNVSYSGICVGWGWTALESGMRNNKITRNTVTDYARRLYDAGGIYTLSYQPGSSITENKIGAPYPAPYATNHRAFSIYFDEATDGYTVENNQCPDEPFGYNKPGPAMIIRNNGTGVKLDW